MDPDSGLNNSYNSELVDDFSVKEPYISYTNDSGIKVFEVVNMIDDSKAVVFSNAVFDENFNFVAGKIHTFVLSTEEYKKLQKLPLYSLNEEIINYEEMYYFIADSSKTAFYANIDGQMTETSVMLDYFKDIIIEDSYIVFIFVFVNSFKPASIIAGQFSL